MIRYLQPILPGEAVYAKVEKDGAYGYTIKVKFADRDTQYGLWWPPELFAEYLSTRQSALSLAADRGFTVVPTWRQARRDYAARSQA